MKIRVYHSGYGCDTGCCGHRIEIDGEDKDFVLSHSDEHDKKQFAIVLCKEYLRENNPECLDTIDWESIDISEVLSYQEC